VRLLRLNPSILLYNKKYSNNTMDEQEDSKVIRIGSFSGFWGDDGCSGATQLLYGNPDINYLVGDYLAEVTMGILARSKNKVRRTFFLSISPLTTIHASQNTK